MATTPDISENFEESVVHRCTSEDEEHQKYAEHPADSPPIVEDWLNREPGVPSTLEILQKYESMFAHRFTSEDEEYQKYAQRPADPPPVVEGWRSRSGGSQRHRDRFRDDRRNRYNRQGGHRTSQWHERGWGNSYQQYRQRQPSYPQHGYGSYSQGPQYGHY